MKKPKEEKGRRGLRGFIRRHKTAVRVLLCLFVLGLLYVAFVTGHILGYDAGRVAKLQMQQQQAAAQQVQQQQAEALQAQQQEVKANTEQPAPQPNTRSNATGSGASSRSTNTGERLSDIDLNSGRNMVSACNAIAKSQAEARRDNALLSENTQHTIEMNRINKMPDGSTDRTHARNQEITRHELAVSRINTAYNSDLIGAGCL